MIFNKYISHLVVSFFFKNKRKIAREAKEISIGRLCALSLSHTPSPVKTWVYLVRGIERDERKKILFY